MIGYDCIKIIIGYGALTDVLTWRTISKKCRILANNVLKKGHFINWQYLSPSQTLSESFIREFQDQVNWHYISYGKLSEAFIREFQHKVNWLYISRYPKSENFIREFQDKVYWGYISQDQNLSEDFIREFQDKVYWGYISQNQNLSEDFIREFQDKVDWYNISSGFIRRFHSRI